MIYGLYLSAAGVMSNSYRQDMITNNIANAETVGFKKDLALFQERRTAAQEGRGLASWSDPIQEKIGGGLLASPTLVDSSQGELEPTGNNLDLALAGPGFFHVSGKAGERLTRDGRFSADQSGNLVMAEDATQKVLDAKGKPIVIDGRLSVSVNKQGIITQNSKAIARVGVVNVPDQRQLKKEGANLESYPDMGKLTASSAEVRGGFTERANVDPAVEMASLMETQRQLEANANMIKYQDQTLGELVNQVGKIS